MEKYSEFRDRATGVQPFLPYRPLRRQVSLPEQVARGVLTYLLGPVLALLRIALLVIVVLWLTLWTGVLAVLPAIPVVHRLLSRYIHGLGAGLALFLLGFLWVPLQSVSPKRRRTVALPVSVDAGDVIVCNYSSYIDLFYLAFRFAPVFTAVPVDQADSLDALAPGMLQAMSLPQALWFCINGHTGTSASKLQPLADIVAAARRRGAPVVVFPEGTTSNNNGILGWLPVFNGLETVSEPRRVSVHILGLKYVFTDRSPAYSIGNIAAHLFHVTRQLYNTLAVKYIASSEVPPIPDPENMPSEADKLPVDLPGWAENISRLLGSLHRHRLCSLNAFDKKRFAERYYRKTRNYKAD